jgi:hypothetical protein
MMQDTADSINHAKEARLPRRDWIVLPMIGLLTVCIVSVSTELIVRRLVPGNDLDIPKCIDESNRTLGGRGIPNSVCKGKVFAGGSIEYRMNSCGHRAGMECGAKAPESYRIVIAGASTAMGDRVPFEKTIAAQLPVELTHKTGRRIELYNEGMLLVFPPALDLRFNEVLAAKPDLILWVLTPYDVLKGTTIPEPSKIEQRIDSSITPWSRLKHDFSTKSVGEITRDLQERSRALLLIRNTLYAHEGSDRYVATFLMNADDTAGFLKSKLSANWQQHLKDFAGHAASIAAQARDANVPLAAVFVPDRAQAIMISDNVWPAGYDPYKLDGEVRTILSSHGATYIDILPKFRNLIRPEELYFPADGHPDAGGHAILSELLAGELTGGSVPALTVAAQPLKEMEQGR